MDLSVIVPCYNEGQNVLRLFRKIQQTLLPLGITYEVIFADDGSTDKTVDVLRELFTEYAVVRVLRFSRNFGKEAAMYAGLSAAKGACCVIMDGDLQHPPQWIAEMYCYLARHPDTDAVAMVQNNRKERKTTILCKHIFYKVFSRGVDFSLISHAGDFRMMRRNVCDAVLSVSDRCRFSKGIFAWVGFKTAYLSYTPAYRTAGKSHFGIGNLLRYGLEGAFSFTNLFSVVCIWLAVIFFLTAVLWKLLPLFCLCCFGFAVFSLLFALLFFCIRCLLCESRQRPLYILREEWSRQEDV